MGFGDWVVGGLAMTNPITGALYAGDQLLNDGGVSSAMGKGLDDVTGEITGANDPANANAPVDTGDLGIQGSPWGGYDGAAQDWANAGMSAATGAMNKQNDIYGAAMNPRGAQSWENQDLSNQEQTSRDWDQAGAIQLAREAAMGQSPSAAAYQMQSGLDQSLAAQQAQMGSARGSAGIALAGGNAAANSANMMNQTYNQAGQLRAQEMANAMGLYGGLSGQQRSQDQARLGQATQNTQFNAGLNDQYQIGMINAASGYGNMAGNWYTSAQNPLTHQATSENSAWDRYYNQHEGAATRASGIAKTNADIEQQKADRAMRGVGMAVDTFGKAALA